MKLRFALAIFWLSAWCVGNQAWGQSPSRPASAPQVAPARPTTSPTPSPSASAEPAAQPSPAAQPGDEIDEENPSDPKKDSKLPKGATAGANNVNRVAKGLIVRVKTKEKTIEDLIFASPNVAIRFLANRPGGEPIAVLQGKFTRQGWNLVFDTHAVFSPKPGKEAFRIGIPISDDITAVKVTAVGPRGQTQIEKFFIQFEGGRDAFLAFLTGKSGDTVEDGPRPADWSVLVRYAFANTTFSGINYDNSLATYANTSFTTMSSAELRWRGPKAAGQVWTWSGSANLEMLHTKVLDYSNWLPRIYFRGFYGSETGKVRYGGLAQLQGGFGSIPIPNTNSLNVETFTQYKVTRYGGGLGAFAVYRPVPTLGVSVLGLVRMDLGGNFDLKVVDDTYARKLLPDLGWEAGFGLVLGLTPKIYLEGRFRGMAEKYSWQSVADESIRSSFQNTYILVDFGFGYKF